MMIMKCDTMLFLFGGLGHPLNILLLQDLRVLLVRDSATFTLYSQLVTLLYSWSSIGRLGVPKTRLSRMGALQVLSE